MNPGRRVPVPFGERLGDLRRGPLTIVVWLAACAAVLGLLERRTQTAAHVGLARLVEYQVSSPLAGSVGALLVDVYEHVERGQILARLDDTVLMGRLGTERARLLQARSELEAERERLRAEQAGQHATWEADLLRFQIEEMTRRVDALALRVELESARVEEQRRVVELAREEPLVGEGVSSAVRVDALRYALQEVRTRIERNVELLAYLEGQAQQATGRREAYELATPETLAAERLLAPLSAAVDVQAGVLDELERERGLLLVRAPVSGQIGSVTAREGQAVVPGVPLLTLAEPRTAEVVAWLPERSARAVEPGAPVVVTRASKPVVRADSVVAAVSATVSELSIRLWRDPSRPEYGRAVLIAVAAEMGLLPGERVHVRLARP